MRVQTALAFYDDDSRQAREHRQQETDQHQNDKAAYRRGRAKVLRLMSGGTKLEGRKLK